MAVRPLRVLELCAGYAGMSLGLRHAGVAHRTVGYVERDSHAAATLVARMEDEALDRAPVWDDVHTFDGALWRGCVDLVAAGFPCQPWSAAGRGGGTDDDRWLWPAIFRIIRDVGPDYVFLENVPGLNARDWRRAGMQYVLADLASVGFDAQWGLLSAEAVGAPHTRDRVWILGYSRRAGRPEITRCAPSDEGAHGRRPGRADEPHGAVEDLGDADVARLGGIGGDVPLGRRLHPSNAHRSDGADVGVTEGPRLALIRGGLDRGSQVTGPERPGGELADASSVAEREPDPEAGADPRQRGARLHPVRGGASSAGQPVADPDSVSCGARVGPDADQRPRWIPDVASGGREWPPDRQDIEGWRDWIASGGPEPLLRREADGATGRMVKPVGVTDRIHLLGNGLVPQCAAAAFVQLAERAGVIR